ncbi:MAG: hypothetical protein A2653_02570 [Candidatus Zambryskibacteria bacterium RIFCSPHIGHO2_01_FULL_43_25]|uniref:Uncharacterized protein n=1 Tax=Candidatus Zambryskibacteria bacterium RIFCSPLOWO2_01_FULL_45_21 TaxID=1802761 RepID=A0A1G2U6W7_9BACT|nr:MAG: hypothetical protein A2653_02570 [Candidatus Zambryskibacteria bacterium RIFCSPHIGHO2_01_FULL_43_25]OHB00349.1 MAG: hypothetical protein A3E94_00965 [Candidatus Zambryskibacteria bacterium RIFCSPHIGHO2_12_FULL_44_12b]OHB04740.1 MAG: hypothetical protein A3B14_03720 [Candidatus Zambryskibacteria bacterium RIFCSPLOWO2_01_FULL_45_21]
MENMENPNNPMEGGVGPQRSSAGPIIGIIIIIVVLVLGGLYFWGQKLSQESLLEDSSMTTETEAMIESRSAAATRQLRVQSASDDISYIEADLNATELESLGSEFDSAESGN